MSFTEGFKQYVDYAPPGVRLPKIQIEDKYYKQLGTSNDISNYGFLRELCLKAVKDKGINKVQNKKL